MNVGKHYPAANTDAVVTLDALPDKARQKVHFIAWSYSAAPTNGRLKIESPSGTLVLDVDITAAGPGFLPLDCLRSAQEQALIITLAAGGASVSGKLTVIYE